MVRELREEVADGEEAEERMRADGGETIRSEDEGRW
jgi:hypothetical protein